MAIQNFLAGGFYGKLGDVVGQRWHNKRTVRSLVIPANPRTEKQQSNRKLFALATALAQQAYNANKGSPLWDTTTMGQFSLMVGTAKRRLQAGMSPEQALPLYPDGYSPLVTLSNPSVDWLDWYPAFTISDNSYTFTKTRQMEVIIQCFNERTNQWEFFSEVTNVPAGSTFSYSFDSDNTYTLPAGSTIQAVSKNDGDFQNTSIRLPPLPITQPSRATISTEFAFTSFVYDPSDNTLVMNFPANIIGKYFELMIEVRAWYVDEGDWDTFGSQITVETDGNARITLEIGEFEYPMGSKILLGDDTDTTQPNADFYFEWPEFDFRYP